MEILGVKWALSSLFLPGGLHSYTTSVVWSLYLCVCFPPYLFVTLSTLFELEHDPTVVLHSQQIKRYSVPVAIKLLILELLLGLVA
jgi:hypothetical protein